MTQGTNISLFFSVKPQISSLRFQQLGFPVTSEIRVTVRGRLSAEAAEKIAMEAARQTVAKQSPQPSTAAQIATSASTALIADDRVVNEAIKRAIFEPWTRRVAPWSWNDPEPSVVIDGTGSQPRLQDVSVVQRWPKHIEVDGWPDFVMESMIVAFDGPDHHTPQLDESGQPIRGDEEFYDAPSSTASLRQHPTLGRHQLRRYYVIHPQFGSSYDNHFYDPAMYSCTPFDLFWRQSSAFIRQQPDHAEATTFFARVKDSNLMGEEEVDHHMRLFWFYALAAGTLGFDLLFRNNRRLATFWRLATDGGKGAKVR